MIKNRLLLSVAAISLCAVWAVAQQQPAGPPPGGGRGPGGGSGRGGRGGGGRGPRIRKVVLAWADTRNGIAQHDFTSHALAIIERLGYESNLWDTYIRTDSNIISYHPLMTTGQPASGGPSLTSADAIFFLGHREIELDAQGRADLLWFVHDAGKGFVSAHTADGAFMSWPEFGQLMGSRYDEHPWNQTEAPLIVVDSNFPGMKTFGTGGMFKDEFYQSKDFTSAENHVVLRLDTTNLDMTKSSVHPGDSYAQAYAKMYGKGRVFYSALGHAPATWDDPRVQDMYLGAIKWALGLVDADVTPNPQATPATAPAAAK